MSSRIEPSSQIRELRGAVHKTRLRAALGLSPCRGNLQRWTSLPVYYQLVYFTVATAVHLRSVSFSPHVSRNVGTLQLRPSLPFYLPFSPILRDAPTGTYLQVDGPFAVHLVTRNPSLFILYDSALPSFYSMYMHVSLETVL